MRKWTRTRWFIFLSVASVYSFGALSVAAERKATEAGKAKTSTEVKLVEDTVPATAAAVPTSRPAEAPSAVAPVVSVNDAGAIDSLVVVDANLPEVLRMISIQAKRNIVASKDVRGSVTANLYNVTIREALDAILQANGCGYREKGNFIYVYSAKELAEIEKAERKTVTEVFRLHYTPAANAANMIKPALSKEGQVAMSVAAVKGLANTSSGGSSGGSGGGSAGTSSSSRLDTGGNALATEDVLVVSDYPDNMDRIRKIIKEIDHRPQQILVEATILSARLTDDYALGVDFAVVGGVDFAGVTSAGLNFADMLTGKVLNTNLPDKGVGGAGTNTISGAPGLAGGKGVRVGVVTNNIALFISALEEVTQTTVLANPKLLTLNKQVGVVHIGGEFGYLTTTVTQTSAVQSVEYLQTGTFLTFRPYIGDDGYIRMEVHPEDSTGDVDAKGLPRKTTTEVTTNVLVKDGHTVLIGGLFREQSSTSRSQVPGLGSIPVVGALFRTQEDRTIRDEIIILLTPHIVKDDSAYSAASQQAMKDLDKLRIGVRRGMMPFGRERLAECFYDQAVAEMAKPHPCTQKAKFLLDCATNMNPLFLEAIKMKETITHREVTSVDNSNVRYFVKRLIMAERGVTVPPKPVVTLAPTSRPAVVRISDPHPANFLPTVAIATPRPVTPTQPAVAATTQPATQSPTATTDENEFPGDLFWDHAESNSAQSAAPTTQPAKDTVVETEDEELIPSDDDE